MTESGPTIGKERRLRERLSSQATVKLCGSHCDAPDPADISCNQTLSLYRSVPLQKEKGTFDVRAQTTSKSWSLQMSQLQISFNSNKVLGGVQRPTCTGSLPGHPAFTLLS